VPRHDKLTLASAKGLWELIPILDALRAAGWEGTTLECRDDDCDCERCRDRANAEAALAWLVGVANESKLANRVAPSKRVRRTTGPEMRPNEFLTPLPDVSK
jgi:hypothetical protein